LLDICRRTPSALLAAYIDSPVRILPEWQAPARLPSSARHIQLLPREALDVAHGFRTASW
jgi:hypothetical protein